MALTKPAFGHHVDVHSEDILDRLRKSNEREESLAPWHRDQQVEVAPGEIIAAGDRPEYTRILHPEVVRQAKDLIPMRSQR
jgi:hypothetical protein